MISIRLPYPPSVNNYWRHSRGRHYISTAGKQYRENVMAAVLSEFGVTDPLLSRLGVLIELTMPDRRRRDVDNVCKAILDAMQYAGIYCDDYQIDDLHVRRVGVSSPGADDVIVQELSQ